MDEAEPPERAERGRKGVGPAEPRLERDLHKKCVIVWATPFTTPFSFRSFSQEASSLKLFDDVDYEGQALAVQATGDFPITLGWEPEDTWDGAYCLVQRLFVN